VPCAQQQEVDGKRKAGAQTSGVLERGQAGGEVQTAAPAGEDKAASKAIRTADAAKGVDSRQAQEGGAKRDGGGAGAGFGGVGIKRLQVCGQNWPLSNLHINFDLEACSHSRCFFGELAYLT